MLKKRQKKLWGLVEEGNGQLEERTKGDGNENASRCETPVAMSCEGRCGSGGG